MRNLKYFSKLSILKVERYLGDIYAQIVSKNFFLRPLNFKNTRNLFEIVQKNISYFSYQKYPFRLVSEILISKFNQFMHRSSILSKDYCSVKNKRIMELKIGLL